MNSSGCPYIHFLGRLRFGDVSLTFTAPLPQPNYPQVGRLMSLLPGPICVAQLETPKGSNAHPHGSVTKPEILGDHVLEFSRGLRNREGCRLLFGVSIMWGLYLHVRDIGSSLLKCFGWPSLSHQNKTSPQEDRGKRRWWRSTSGVIGRMKFHTCRRNNFG
jgi:hypothetical protein